MLGLNNVNRIKFNFGDRKPMPAPFHPPKEPKEFALPKIDIVKEKVAAMSIGGDIGRAVLNSWLGYESTRFKQFLNSHGGDKIESLEVGRVPISNMVNMAMNVLSAGKFEEIKKASNVDDYFHLYLIINKKFIIEKNEIVNIKPYKKVANETTYNVPLNFNGVIDDITIEELIENAAEGDPKGFWIEYNPVTANCQMWVSRVLKKNNLMTDDISSFTNQNMKPLLEGLPEWTTVKARQITGVAGYINRILQKVSGGRLGFAKGSSDLQSLKRSQVRRRPKVKSVFN